MASMLALQRTAGNASTLALLRRERSAVDEPPMTLSLPGVSEHIALWSWSFDNESHGRPTGLHITRPTDADSPTLAKAAREGSAGVTATLRARQLTLTLDDCAISSYVVGDRAESLGLTFTGLHLEP
jgi:hypothetical protein